MPETVATLVASYVLSFGPPTVLATYAYAVAYVATVVAIVAAAEDARRSAANKARDAYNRSQSDRYLMVRGNLEPRRVVLGRRRTSGPMFYVGSYGTDREHLVFCVALAGHEVDAIETVLFNDEPLVLDGSGNVLGLLRTEQFSISDDEATVFLTGEAEAGTVTATAYYGSEAVTLTVDDVDGREVSVSGAHASPDVGRLEIQYQPYPNPFKPDVNEDGYETTTGTGSSQTVTLDHTPISGSITIVEGTLNEGSGLVEITSFTVAGADVTFTATNGEPVSINYQWTDSTSLARVRKYTGRRDQAADAALIAALPDLWTTEHRAAGVAYLVVELDYDREALSTGEPNVSAVVRGAKCYDPRKNEVPNPMMDGAAVGTPGTLPTGWSSSATNGLSYDVVDHGTDPLTGWPFVTLHYTGTATATGTLAILPTPFAIAPAASPGQAWACRAMVRRVAGDPWSVWTSPRLSVLRYDSGGAVSTESSTTITADMVDGHQDPIEVEDASLASGATKAGMRVALGYTNGQVVDQTIMVLLPQLWQGEVGDEADPYAFSENLALQCATYATHPIGGRLPWDQVDLDWLTDSANVCDTETTYTVGGKDYERPLYTGGYVALASQVPTQVLSDLCLGMGGEWAYVDGKLKIKSGGYRSPVLTIDESWLQGEQPVQVQAAVERDMLVNCMRGSFIDARQAYRAVAFPPVEPEAYIAADRAKLPQELEYGAIDFEGQAQYVASCALRQGRQGMVVNLMCNYRAWQAQTFDTVAVNLDRFGWSGKVFEVRSDGFTLDGGIKLVLRETGASIWDMDAGFPASDPEPNTRLPDPWWIEPITGLDADSGNATLLTQADGTVVARVSVTWDAIVDPRVTDPTGRIEIAWKRFDATEWQTFRVPGDSTQAYITPAPDGSYILVKAKAIGSVGESLYCPHLLHRVIGKTDAPADVDNFDAEKIGGAVRLSWDECPDADYAVTEIRVGGSNWATATRLFRGRANTYDWAWPADGSYTLRARHEDSSGNLSTTTENFGITIADELLITTDLIDEDAATQVLSATDTTVTQNDAHLAEITFTAPVDCDVVVTTRGACESESTPVVTGNPRIRFGPVVWNSAGDTIIHDGRETRRYLIYDGVDFQAPLYNRTIYSMTAGQTARFSAGFAGDFTPDPANFLTTGTTYCELEVIKR